MIQDLNCLADSLVLAAEADERNARRERAEYDAVCRAAARKLAYLPHGTVAVVVCVPFIGDETGENYGTVTHFVATAPDLTAARIDAAHRHSVTGRDYRAVRL